MKSLHEAAIHWSGDPAELGEITVGIEDGSFATAYFGSPAAVSEHLEERCFPGLSKKVDGLGSTLIGYISAIEIAPERRRQGIGSLFIRTLMETLKELGARKVFLHAAASSGMSLETLQAFYEGLGFREDGCCYEDRWPVFWVSLR